MFTLSSAPVIEEYVANNGTDVLLGTEIVRIITEYRQTKSGSWEKGFRFGSITYGMLRRTVKKKYSWSKTQTYDQQEFSCDHGKTWHANIKAAIKSKGKVIVARTVPVGEFAFDAIQKINREYEGPGYKWTP